MKDRRGTPSFKTLIRRMTRLVAREMAELEAGYDAREAARRSAEDNGGRPSRRRR